MPITWITFLIGSLALIGTPFFSGFYSKESIIEAVHLSQLPVSNFVYFAVMAGVFVTAFYSFRLYFLVFHGKERFGKADQGHDHHHGLAPGQKPHESPWVVWLPLVLLAIPSVVIGYLAFDPILHGGYFGDAIVVAKNRFAEAVLHHEVIEHPFTMAVHALSTLPFWLAVAGVASSAFLYLKRPDIPEAIKQRFSGIYTLLDNKYYFDRFNDWFFAGGARVVSRFLWKFGDVKFIDGLLVNGSARLIVMLSGVVRRFQTGYIYHYAFSMIIGVFVLLTIRTWFD